MKDPERGMKVAARLHGKPVPAIVLSSRLSPRGNYKETKLRIAQRAELSDGWIISNYEEPVQSYKLTRRDTIIPGLDDVPLPVQEEKQL